MTERKLEDLRDGALARGIVVGNATVGANTFSGSATIVNNYIGTNSANTNLGNSQDGILIAGNALINNQFPIVTVSDPSIPSVNNPYGNADSIYLFSNSISSSSISWGSRFAASIHSTILGIDRI